MRLAGELEGRLSERNSESALSRRACGRATNFARSERVGAETVMDGLAESPLTRNPRHA